MVMPGLSTKVLFGSGFVMATGVFFATPARGADSTEALEELRVGYSLKQAGNCQDALPHLARSFRLEPTARAALNLSDCEQHMGDLVGAQGHAALGADLAHQQNDAELAGVADTQLAAIEQRLPRLTVKVVQGSPDCAFTRDGAVLAPASLGTPLAVNPGAHAIGVTCPGHADRTFDVSVAEGDRTETTVSPGPATSAPASPEAPAPAPQSVAPPEVRGGNPKIVPLVVMGVGAAGLAVGLVTGLVADAKHASLLNNCDPGGACPVAQSDTIDAFRRFRTVSTVTYAVGAVALVGGGVWWLVAPSPHRDGSARVWVGPGSAGVRGQF
jgi:hypothetical protein